MFGQLRIELVMKCNEKFTFLFHSRQIFIQISGQYFRDFSRVLSIGVESFRDPKSLENFLTHFSTSILAENVYYY